MDSMSSKATKLQHTAVDVTPLFTENFNQFDDWIDELCQDFLKSSDNSDGADINQIQGQFNSAELPDNQWHMDEYLKLLQEDVLPHSSHLASPTYIGHMTSPLPNFVSQMSRLVMILNQNMMKIESCRGLHFLERQVLAMLHREVFGRTESFYQQFMHHRNANLGCFTSGGTIANITAMWMARNKAEAKADHDSDRKGVILGSELMHYSFDKAADLLGLKLVRLPVDDHYQLCLHAFAYSD